MCANVRRCESPRRLLFPDQLLATVRWLQRVLGRQLRGRPVVRILLPIRILLPEAERVVVGVLPLQWRRAGRPGARTHADAHPCASASPHSW